MASAEREREREREREIRSSEGVPKTWPLLRERERERSDLVKACRRHGLC